MKSKTLVIFVSILLIMQMLLVQVYAKDNNETTDTENEIVEEKEQDDEEETVTIKENNIKAIVVSAGKAYKKEDEETKEKYYVQDVTLKLKSGIKKGEKIDATYIISYDTKLKIKAKELKENQVVYVDYDIENGEAVEAEVTGVIRQNYIILLAIILVASILAIGKKKGIKLLIDIVMLFVCIYAIFILNIYNGYNIYVLVTITSMVIVVASSFIRNGINKRSIATILSTMCTILFAGFIMILFSKISGITVGQSEAIVLNGLEQANVIHLRNLMFAGVIISCIGGTLEVSSEICYKLALIKKENHAITWKELFKEGMKIGTDNIFKIANTLIFSLVGGTLAFNILFGTISSGFLDFINIEIVTTCIICILSCAIGVIYIVPITSIIFALLNKDKLVYKNKSENIIDGKRSLKI